MIESDLELVKQLASGGGACLDIGAHNGEYSRAMAELSTGPVFAYEPNPVWYEELQRRRYVKNGSVAVMPYAISDANGTATLTVPRLENRFKHTWSVTPMGSLDAGVDEYVEQVSGDKYRGHDEYEVQTVTLDSLMLEDVRLIKIDVEGHEEAVIAGGIELLRGQMPTVHVELEERFNPGVHERFFELMSSLGYDGFFFVDGRYVPVYKFDVEAMQTQPLEAIKHRLTPNIPGYVNNFTFFG